MALTVDHLRTVRAELFQACTKWYDIGLELRVPVNTLDGIKLDGQFGNHSDKLRETLKVWLKTATEPSWQDVVGVLKSPVVGEPKLASDIGAKYCTTAETGQASGLTMPEMQPQRKRYRATDPIQQALENSQELLQFKDQQLRDSQRHMHTLQQELQESQRQIKELTHLMERKNEQLQTTEIQCEQTIGELRTAINQLKQQLQQAQQRVEEEQHAREEREGQVRELTKQLQAMKGLGIENIMEQNATQNMRWQKESKAPQKMVRGSAASDYNLAYFSDRDTSTILSYNFDTREWYQLPDVPHARTTLVVVQHILSTVGGQIKESGEATGSILSLVGKRRNKKWMTRFPALPTKRYGTAAVCSGHSLIVTGGYAGSNILATVEVLDTDTQQWSIASSLPHPFTGMTISICGERLYMLGGGNENGPTHSVLSCSVPELLRSCQPQPLAGNLKPRTAPANQSTIWTCIADVPHYMSSCATLCGKLVAVGGCDEADNDTGAITGYNERTNSWEAMGNMPTARQWALVAIVLDEKLMVVGGWAKSIGSTDVVEILC